MAKRTKARAKTAKQIEAELATMRNWLRTLAQVWTGEAAHLEILAYTNKRPLTDTEHTWSVVIRRAAAEVQRVLDEAPARSRA